MHIVVYRKKMTVETKGCGHIEEPLPARGASVTYTGKRGRLRLPRRPPPGHGGGDGAGGGCPALRRGPQPAGVRRAVNRLSPPGGGRAGHCRGHHPGDRHSLPGGQAGLFSDHSSGGIRRRPPAPPLPPPGPAGRPGRHACRAASRLYPPGCGHPPGVLRGLCGHRLRRSLPDRD